MPTKKTPTNKAPVKKVTSSSISTQASNKAILKVSKSSTPFLEEFYGTKSKSIATNSSKQEKLANLVDFKRIIKTYDVDSIRSSLVLYVTESIRWFDGLLALLSTLSNKHRVQISAAQKLTGNLLAAGEHDDQQVLIDRTEYLIKHLNLGMDVLQNDLLALKYEIVALNDTLYTAKSLDALCDLESSRRPDFSLIAEHSFAMVKRYLQQLDWFLEHQKAISSLVTLHNEWRADFHSFEHTTHAHFMEKCRHKKIPKQISEAWFTEWQHERLSIESHLLALMKAAIDDKVIPVESAIKAATLLKLNLCDKFHDFFSDGRIDLHIKFALQPGYELLERFEKDAELSRINAGFQKALEDLIFKIDSIEGRLFLTRWAKDWYDALIGDVIAYIERGALLERVAKATLEEFRAMKQRNLEAFLIDAKSYAEAREQKNSEFNELMYRMKQDLVALDFPKASKKKGNASVASI